MAEMEAYKGHGDISTRWYGCLIIFDIIELGVYTINGL